MNIWKSIALKDVGAFKDVKFAIPRGITTIYGSNNDVANTNAAGKSMLFSSIFDTLYEEPIAAEKADRIKSGTRAVELLVGKKPLSLTRMNSKAELRIGDVAVHGITNVRRKLQEVLPWSWDDVITFIHLDSQVPHPLVKGTNAHRKAFLTSFFDLDKIDTERALIKAALEKVAGAADQADGIKAEIASLKVPPKGFVGAAKKRHHALQTELDKLQEESSEVEEARRAAIFADQAANEIRHYKHARNETGKTRLSDMIALYEEDLNKQERRLNDAEASTEARIKQEAYDKWLKSLSPATVAFLKSGKVDVPINKIAAKVKLAKDKIDDAQQRLERLKRVVADKPEPVLAPTTISYKDALARLSRVEDQLKHAAKFGTGECPTCGQSVKTVDVPKLKGLRKRLQDAISQHEAAQAHDADMADWNEASNELTELRGKLKQMQDYIAKYGKYVRIADELRVIPEKPKQVDQAKLIDAKITRKIVDELQTRLKALQFLKRNEDVFVLAIRNKVQDSDMPTLDRIADLSRELTQLDAKIERAIEAETKHAKLSEELAALEPKIKRARAIKKLLTAYDDKAMKRLVIQAISKRLMQQVNKYAKLAFQDDFHFTLEWDSSQVQFLVHRRYGKRVDTTDVRRLSGAETKLFTIVLILALLSFVPTHKRSSMIVLDEPAANMGDTARASFIELLQVLKTVIPSVIIVTPRSEERYGGHEFTITKRKGTTTIVKGHPSQIAANGPRFKEAA